MKRKSTLVLLMLVLFFSTLSAQQYEPNALEWRFIGPIVGNRGSVVIGHPTKPDVFYNGASNGLWKTEDAGTYWQPMPIKFMRSSTLKRSLVYMFLMI